MYILREQIIELIKNYNIKIKDFKLAENIYLSGVSTFYDYKPDTFTWLKNKNIFLNHNQNKKIQFIIVSEELNEYRNFNNYIVTPTPKELFFLIVKEFFTVLNNKNRVDNSTVSPKAVVGNNVVMGNYCTVEDNVKIGKNTIIGNNVVIKSGTNIGDNCIIQSGVIIGEEGFGFMDIDNKKVRVPHLGGVEIGNYVEIGVNTCIVRGTIDNTIIKNNVKIDNLCHIAHNVIIEENTVVVAQTLLGGSVKIGKNCWISTSSIRNQLNIGDNSLVGIGSVVVKDVPDNTIVYGNPAKKGMKK